MMLAGLLPPSRPFKPSQRGPETLPKAAERILTSTEYPPPSKVAAVKPVKKPMKDKSASSGAAQLSQLRAGVGVFSNEPQKAKAASKAAAAADLDFFFGLQQQTRPASANKAQPNPEAGQVLADTTNTSYHILLPITCKSSADETSAIEGRFQQPGSQTANMHTQREGLRVSSIYIDKADSAQPQGCVI